MAGTLVQRDASGNFAAGTITADFNGNGANLTNLNASAVAAGTLADARLSSNVALLDTDQTFIGTNTFSGRVQMTNAANTVAGTFTGDGAGLTNLPIVAASLPSGVLLASTLAQDTALIASGYRLAMSSPAAAWVNGSTSNAPLARSGHSAVWSGQALLIWGGNLGGGTFSSAGGMYRPDSDIWGLISTVGAPSARSGHTTVWSGTEMIVWGGSGTSGNYLGTGGRYAPDTQAWTTMATNGAPAGRNGHVAVWTGNRMLIWGGVNPANLLDDGGLYDPASNAWTPLTIPNPPEARMNAVAVWANDRLIVWGGEGASGELATGAQLTFTNGVPATWTTLSVANAPSPRTKHSAVWTDDQVIVWGGQAGGVPLGDGAAYQVRTDAWQPLSTTNAPTPRYGQAGLWTGAEMLIVGGANAAGALSTSAAYDPGTGLWRALSNTGNPLARSGPGAVWSGTEILVFGGISGSQPVATLQRLFPQSAWYFYRKL
jgi:hypothetical protein